MSVGYNSGSSSNSRNWLLSIFLEVAGKEFGEEEFIDCNNRIRQKQNQIKNLLRGFQKFLGSAVCREKQTAYVVDVDVLDSSEKSSVDSSFKSLRRAVSKRVGNRHTRWNMKLKSLVKSKTIGRAFRQFLERDAEMWLNNSKVEDKDQIKLLITYLLGLLQTNTVESLDTAIKTYKK